jgi:hypothetical protein
MKFAGFRRKSHDRNTRTQTNSIPVHDLKHIISLYVFGNNGLVCYKFANNTSFFREKKNKIIKFLWGMTMKSLEIILEYSLVWKTDFLYVISEIFMYALAILS